MTIHGNNLLQSSKRNFLFLSGVLLFTAIVFSPVLSNRFVNWDDPDYLTENYLVSNLSGHQLKLIFSSLTGGHYVPLTVLSYSIEHYFFGLHPKIFHLTNWLLHLLNTLLVFRFIFLLSGKSNIAAVTALLFGIHPLHVESVAWVTERKDVLYTCFYLFSLICYIFFHEKKDKKYYLLALLFFLFSLLAKPLAVTVPLIFLMIDYFQQKKFTAQIFTEKIPFFIFSLIFGVITIYAQQSANAIQSLSLFSWGERILIACYCFLAYLYKLLLPINLSCYYPYPDKINDHLPLVFYFAPLFIFILGYFIFKSLRFNRILFFSFGFYFITVALVLQFIGIGSLYIIADRYTYLSYTGIFFLIGYGYDVLAKKIPKHKSFLTIFLFIVTGLLGFLSYERCKIWKDDFTLWSDCILKHPNPIAYNNLGIYFFEQKNYELALSNYQQALSQSPGYDNALQNRGNVFFAQKKYEDAFNEYTKALEINPLMPNALNSKGAVFFIGKQYDSAIVYYSKAIEMKNDFRNAYQNRANAFNQTGNYESAINDCNASLQIFENNAAAYYYRANAKFGLKKYNEAVQDYTRSLEIYPSNAVTYLSRSKAFQAQGNFEQALQDALKAKLLGMEVDENYMESLKR